jgi:hypothetical protein
MTAMGLLSYVTVMSVSMAKPLDQLSPVRPLNSIFHPVRENEETDAPRPSFHMRLTG